MALQKDGENRIDGTWEQEENFKENRNKNDTRKRQLKFLKHIMRKVKEGLENLILREY